ncbi:sulfotransferase [soil metagenome]
MTAAHRSGRDLPLTVRARRGVIRVLRAARKVRGHQPPGPGRPPRVPAGWVVAPPDFVGIGVQKAGTSWWNELIGEHPDVYRAGGQPKELHFFDEYWERPFTDADVARYARYFPRPTGGIAGEWTPGYMIDFWAPNLIRQATPEARIVVLLRDPVERYRSGMLHTDDMERRALGRQDAVGAFGRGLYAQQLRRVFAAFPREQVLLLQYERCRIDPAGELARTFRFLGLRDVRLDPVRFDQPVNPTTARKAELGPELRAALTAAYAPDLAQLAALVPELDLDLWPAAQAGT